MHWYQNAKVRNRAKLVAFSIFDFTVYMSVGIKCEVLFALYFAL